MDSPTMVTLLVTFKRTRRRKPWLKCFDLIGEPDGIRTHDPLIKSQVLYRLSYGLSAWPTIWVRRRKGQLKGTSRRFAGRAAQITASRKPTAFSKLPPSLGTRQGGGGEPRHGKQNGGGRVKALLAAPFPPHPVFRGVVGPFL